MLKRISSHSQYSLISRLVNIVKYNYKPKTKLEKFGVQVYSALVENFKQTFFVGGMVRDLLLQKKITDIDIATVAKPEQVVAALKKYYIETNIGFKKMGAILAVEPPFAVAITSFRKDLPSDTRYPEVSFTKNIKIDAGRRDFTINSLYLRPKSGTILDFYNGLSDIKNKQVRFIGKPEKKIKEDPLRIVRALRFALVLNFGLEKKAKATIKKYFNFVKELTAAKLKKEIDKVKNKQQKKILEKVINNPKLLDKYFK